MRICNALMVVLCLVGCGFSAGPVLAQEETLEPRTSREQDAGAIRNSLLLSSIRSGYAVGTSLADKKAVQTFYDERQGNYLWVDDHKFTKAARDVFALIQSSYEHGLNPDNYHRALLAPMIREQFKTPEQEVQAELLMADAVIRLGSDLSGMRLSAKLLNADSTSWSRGVDPLSLLNVLSRSSDPAHVLAMLAPQDSEYKNLQKELKRILDDYAEHKDGRYQRISFGGVLYPGQSHAVVPALRQKLGISSRAAQAELYDGKLVEAVEGFQRARGLKDDGVIGPRTMIALNEGPRDRLIKVIANLERRRWIRRLMPPRYVEVNIPAMWLKAIDDNKVQFEMPVIVGRKKRQTVSFVDEIVGVRFNPSWYVPDTIKKEDYLPKLKEDPQALAEKGIAFRIKDQDTGQMVTVLPEDIVWSGVTQADLKSIQMVQGPGAANALGQIRVLMPNRYDIYLHDTNAPEIFRKDDRAQSSGCVRMSEPRRMANFILGHNKMWSEDRLDSYLGKGKTLEIKAEVPVPVYLFYFTIWQNKDGKLIFGNDIYGLDAELVDILKSNGQVNFPMI